MKKIYLWLLLPLLIFGGCESLEDTYKDYAGDGPIRYLVKCDDLDVKAGWNRLVVSWKSVDDPIIDKVKVSWTVDGIGRDTLLERGTFACSLPCDGNLTYQVTKGTDGIYIENGIYVLDNNSCNPGRKTLFA